MSLTDKLQSISSNLGNQREELLQADEGAAIRISVLPFIEALGFDSKSLAEVRSEANADARTRGRRKVDYEVYRDEQPILMIEAKPAQTSLAENEWDQLKGYYNDKVKFRFGVLTNGLEFRFYTDLEEQNLMDKEPFLVLNMLKIDARLISELEAFTKQNFDLSRCYSIAMRLMVSKLMKREYDHPSNDFAQYFAKKVHPNRKLTGSDLKEFSTIVRQAWHELVSHEIANRLQVSQTNEPPANMQSVEEQTGTEGQCQFTDDFQKRQVPIPIHIDYRPRGSMKIHKLRGTLLLADDIDRQQDIIEYDGERLAPSEAGGRALRSVKPDVSNPNGWVMWKFVNPNTGEDDVIDLLTKDENLRRQLLRQQ